MTVLALDTDVLVGWLHEESEHHEASRRLVERELADGETRLGLTAQVLFEVVHVITDARRFESPLSVDDATGLVGDLWQSPDVDRVPAPPRVLPRTLELLREHRLGRKRILDTALAATLETAGIRRLATWNPRDYQVFGFLETVSG
jgi:predicted nucleic acid-binding protein